LSETAITLLPPHLRRRGHVPPSQSFLGFDTIIRVNRTVLLALLWGALFACVAAASIYDVSRWINLW
jgi:hypothetical protein